MRRRRKKAEVPASVSFATKSAIALEQLRAARAARIPVGVVLADAGYGNDTDFRLGITELGLTYAVGIQGSTTVWAEGHQPLPPRGDWGRGRPGTHLRRNRTHQPIDVKALAHELPRSRLAAHPVARGHGRRAGLALCAPTGQSGASRCSARRRVVGDRMAAGRD